MLRNPALEGVILRSERGEAAATQVSAGPKDLFEDATRPWRGSVTMIEVAQRSANPAACPPHLGSPALQPWYPCGCRGGPRESSVRSFGPASTAWTQGNGEAGPQDDTSGGRFLNTFQDDTP